MALYPGGSAVKKPAKARNTVRTVEAARARKAARMAKARRAGHSTMASRTAQTTLAAAIGAGILLQGGHAAPGPAPAVEVVVDTVAVTVPADDEPAGDSGSSSTESSSTGSSSTGSSSTESSSTETASGASEASGADDGQTESTSSSGSEEATTNSKPESESAQPAQQAEQQTAPAEEAAGAGDAVQNQPAPPTSGDPGGNGATPPAQGSTTQATTSGNPGTSDGAVARSAPQTAGVVLARPGATPTSRVTHAVSENLLTRIALGLIGLAPHSANTPAGPLGPAAPTSALLIAQWAFFRRGENSLFNQSPVADPTPPVSTSGLITGDLNVTDPDRDHLSYTVGTQPEHGEVTVEDDGTYTYTPDTGFVGTDTFTITVRDNNPAAPGLGAFTTLARQVLARSHPALAQRLFGAHAINVTVDVTVTASSDVDVTVGTPDPGTGVVRGSLPATDPDGTPLTYTVTTPPRHGRVTIAADGTFVYTPSAAGQAYAASTPGSDVDTFTVTASTGVVSGFRALVADGDDVTVAVPLAPSQPSAPPTVTGSTGVGANPAPVVMSPDSRYGAVVSFQDGTVAIVDTTTGNAVLVPAGPIVDDVAFSPDGGRVYLLERSGTVTLADSTTGEVLGTFDLGDDANALRVGPDGRYLYARGTQTDELDGTVTPTLTVIDTVGLTATPLAVGAFYNGVQFSPDGSRGYAIDGATGSVLIINTSNSAIVGTIEAGSGAYQVVFSPDGTRAYIPNDLDGTVTVIRTLDDTVGPVITVGGAATALLNNPQFSPDGRYLYALDHSGGTVAVIDTVTDTVGAPIPVDAPSEVVFSPDGSRAYVIGGIEEDTITVIRTSNRSVVTIPTAPDFREVVFSPDGSRAYVVSYDGTVTVIDVGTDTVDGTYAAGAQAFDLVVAPDGARIYVVNDNDEPDTTGSVTAIDTATGAPTTITVGDQPYGPLVSSDGRRVYVTNYLGGSVSVIDTADDTVVDTVPGADAEARFTPDGRYVYVVGYAEPRGGVTFISTADDAVTFIPAAEPLHHRRRPVQRRRAHRLRRLERGERGADRDLPRRRRTGGARRWRPDRLRATGQCRGGGSTTGSPTARASPSMPSSSAQSSTPVARDATTRAAVRWSSWCAAIATSWASLTRFAVGVDFGPALTVRGRCRRRSTSCLRSGAVTDPA